MDCQNHNNNDFDRAGYPACEVCGQGDACREVWSRQNKGPLSPAGLVLASMAAFVLPILCAVAGGVLATVFWGQRDHADGIQAGSVLGGLVIGIFLAWVTMPLVKKRFPKTER